MSGFRIEGASSGYVAEVDSNNNLKVNLPTVNSQAGLAGIGAIIHDGATGAARVVRAADVSINRRLRVGIDTLFFQDNFSYTAQHSAVWNMPVTTWSAPTFASGFIKLISTVAAGNVLIKTYKMFPLYNGAGLSIEVDALILQPLQSGEVIEFGMFQASASTAPTDGMLFRYTTGGALQGVVNYNGGETNVDLGTPPATGVTHSYLMRVEQEETSFWVDNVLLGKIATPVTAAGPSQCAYQPICCRMYAAGATSVIQTVQIGEVRVFLRDLNSVRPWAQTMAGLGNMGSQGQQGGTQGTTALMVNGAGSALVSTAPLANNANPSTVFLGLGGNVAMQVTQAANTDAWIFGYLVPVGTAAIPGKSLIITGVKINGVVTTIFTNGPLLAIYSLAYGGTNALAITNLTQAESATAKAFRRIPLGIETYPATAAVGTMGQGVTMQFLSPICVHPGEVVGVVMKNVGTAVTAAGAVTYVVAFDAHWE